MQDYSADQRMLAHISEETEGILGRFVGSKTAATILLALGLLAATPQAAPFADANIPPVGWQFPLTDNPFTAAICEADPCNPTLDPNSTAQVANIMGSSFSLGEISECEPGTNCAGEASTSPVYYASESDPLYYINCIDYGKNCGITSIRLPNGATASIHDDHHLSVIETYTNPEQEVDFEEFNCTPTGSPPYCGSGSGSSAPLSGGGTVNVGYGGTCTVLSFESGANGCDGAGISSNTPIQNGLIDPMEWVNGYIDHTIYIAIQCPIGTAYVFPAGSSGDSCGSIASAANGERVWLDLSDRKIRALPVHHWTKVLLRAMHKFGAMVVDSSGPGSTINYYGADNATYTLWGRPAPWTTFFTMVTEEGDGGKLGWGDNASHLQIPTTGITQSNIHIVP